VRVGARLKKHLTHLANGCHFGFELFDGAR
jgi:hypothetical protein